jgi:hypothetical protein
MTDATDTLVNTVVPIIGLGMVAGMAGRMMDNDDHHEHRHTRRVCKRNKRGRRTCRTESYWD